MHTIFNLNCVSKLLKLLLLTTIEMIQVVMVSHASIITRFMNLSLLSFYDDQKLNCKGTEQNPQIRT